jgi:hypothetical protein
MSHYTHSTTCLSSKLSLAEQDAAVLAGQLDALGRNAPELAAAEAESIRDEIRMLRRRLRILVASVANGDAVLGDSCNLSA